MRIVWATCGRCRRNWLCACKGEVRAGANAPAAAMSETASHLSMVVDLSVLLSGYCGTAAAASSVALQYDKQQVDMMLRPVVLQRIVRGVPFFSGLMQAGVSLGRK